MRHRLSVITGVILIILGLLVFLSPEWLALYQAVRMKAFVKNYEVAYGRTGFSSSEEEGLAKQSRTDSVGRAEQEQVKDAGTEENRTEDDWMENNRAEDDRMEHEGTGKEKDPLYREICAYNKALFQTGQKGFSDPWYYETAPLLMEDFADGIIGYIQVQDLGQTFKLYAGATEDALSDGVAVVGQTSLPVGGNNTNCVIAGHRGYNQSKTFFKDIEEVKVGSYVRITNPWGMLTYQVTGTDIIDPDDSDKIKIQKGKDMVTLLTCHPYGSEGRYRYLVYCERTEEDGERTAPQGGDSDQRTLKGQSETAEGMENGNQMADGNGRIYELSGGDIRKEYLFRMSLGALLLCMVILCILRKKGSRTKGEKHEA